MKKASPEHSFQVFVINYLRWNGIYCFTVPNGGKRDVKTGAYLKKEGQLAGVADLVLCLPVLLAVWQLITLVWFLIYVRGVRYWKLLRTEF